MASTNKQFPGIGAALATGGEMGERIARFDWSSTPVGPMEDWPASLSYTVSLILRSAIPMVILWGPDGVMIFNDGYSQFAGGRNSRLLGLNLRDGWEEVAEFNDHVMRTGLAGHTLQYRNLEITLVRDGRPEQMFMDLDYSPVLGDDGEAAGILAILADTTRSQQNLMALEQSESRLRFLDELGTAVSGSRDADEILAITTRMTAQHLGALNCAYADMDPDEDGFTIRYNSHAPAAAPLVGHYKLSDFGTRAMQELHAGRALVLHDNLAELSPHEAKAFRDIGIAATICMPLVKEGRLTALMAVHNMVPRRWSDYDLSIIREVTERSWAHIERARTEQELQRHAELLRRSQEAGSVGLFSVDVLTNVISCTPEFCRIFGLEIRDTWLAADIERLIVPEDSHLGSNDERRRAGSAQLDIEYRIYRADTGEERVIARKGEYERDDNGNIMRIIGAVQDRTERNRIQSALDKSEAGFSALAEVMPNQVWTARADGGLDWFNGQTYIYSGLPDGSLLGDGWAQMVHPDDVVKAGERWTSALAGTTTFEHEYRLRNAQGEYRWFLTRAVPLPDPAGTNRSWIGTNTDIHEQKLLEAARTADHDRLWALSQDLLMVCDENGDIVAINPSAQRMLGWDEDEMLGKRIADFVHPDDLDRTVSEIAKVNSGTVTLHFENRYRAKGGSYRLLDWTAVAESHRIHAVGRDITDQRETEEALRQSQKMEAVGQLTGGIAHDFNNLLQGITGSLEIMEGRVAQGRAQDLGRWLTGAKSSAMRAAALTHRLLAFSRRQPLDPRSVRANPLVASMEDMLRRTLGEGTQLELVLAGGLWLTKCDVNQLESAILNLAINARDAMPGGGRLTIETCNAHLDSAYAARQRDVKPGQYICICVTDTGTGMSKDVIARAFEPFFTTKPTGQGTGLGLSMIYGFARQSEGYARIYSEVGKGSTVKLYLPRFRGEDERPDDIPTLAEAPGTEAGEVVLVVEDEAVVRGLIVEVLNELGYSAIEASDGARGLEILQSDRKIDLLITDIGLPELNGRQVADGGRVSRPDLKILFMTGYAENAALASGFLEPGMAMITKPFAMEALASRIREIIEEKGGVRKLA